MPGPDPKRRERHDIATVGPGAISGSAVGVIGSATLADHIKRPEAAAAIGLATQIGYGAGQIGTQIFRDVPSLLLLFFMTTVLGIAPALAGAAIFFPKLVFAVCFDMTAGILSDRWQNRISRRWWILAGALGTPVAMILLFHVPDTTTMLQVVYLTAVLSFYMAVYSCFSVPYLAIAGKMTPDPQARTVLMAWRWISASIGILTGAALAPAIVQSHGGGQPGYEAMSLMLAVICPASLLVAFVTISRFTPDIAVVVPRIRISFREAIAVLMRPRFSLLVGVSIMQLAGSGMTYASLLYFLSYNMGRSDALHIIGGIVLAAVAGIIVAQPFWVALSRQIGKRRSYVLGSVVFGFVYIVWACSAHAGVGFAYVLSFIGALGQSGWAMLGFSMVSDIAGDDEAHAGLYSGAWVASDKIGFALGGTLLVGLTLSGFGFDSLRAVKGLPQSASALTGVMFAFGFIPGALNLTGATILGLWGRD